MRMRDVTVHDGKHQALDLSDTDNGHVRDFGMD